MDYFIDLIKVISNFIAYQIPPQNEEARRWRGGGDGDSAHAVDIHRRRNDILDLKRNLERYTRDLGEYFLVGANAGNVSLILVRRLKESLMSTDLKASNRRCVQSTPPNPVSILVREFFQRWCA